MIDQKLFQWLTKKLSYYQKILLIINSKSWENFCVFEKELHSDKRVLILSTYELKCNHSTFIVQKITKHEMEQICRLLYLYEFSDHLIMISDENNSFPNLEQFRDTGLLTEDEFWQAVLF